ncbi:MAG: hypothetical protein AAF773_02435 [Cyanobacteria bacterium P01_D01_bin.115]
MSIFISWLDLILKLGLLTGAFLGSFAYLEKVRNKQFSWPLITAFSLPFFLSYKIMDMLGQESRAGTAYLAIVVFCNFFLWVQFWRKKSNLQDFGRPISEAFSAHQLFLRMILGLFIIFCLRGLYLEYPGDAIIYFQRVGQANQDSGIINIASFWQYDANQTFFSSFQQWLVGSDALMRDKLTVVAAVSACLLCTATYRLCLWFSSNRRSAAIATLLGIAFYGNLQISFYLYKILQGATLAMVVYLEAIPLLHPILLTSTFKDLFSSRRICIFVLFTGAIWVCLDCHQEKILYIFAVVLSTSSLTMLKAFSKKSRPPLFTLITFLATIGGLLLLFFNQKPPLNVSPLVITSWLSIGQTTLFTYWPSSPNASYLLLDLISLGLSLIILSVAPGQSKLFYLATVTLAPCFFFVNPIAITGLLKITSPYNIYRLMLGGLPWIFLPVTCDFLSNKQGIKLGYLPGIFLILGLFAYPPIYGKLPHLSARVPTYADGSDLSSVIQHLLLLRQEAGDRSINVLSTPYVNSYLAAWPALTVASSRWLSNDPEVYGEDLAYLFSSNISDTEVAQILSGPAYDVVVLDARENLVYSSWLGRMTTHWPADLIQTQRAFFNGGVLHEYLSQHPEKYVNILNENGFQVYQKRELSISSDSF